MKDPAALFLLAFAACGMVLMFIRGYYSWPRGFFAGEEAYHGPPTTVGKVFRTAVSAWLVWVALRALLTNRLSIMVPGRFDPHNFPRAARIVLHGLPLAVMCLACLSAATALMLGWAWWRHLGAVRTVHRRLLRTLSFLAVAFFGLSLLLWLHGKITE